MIALAFRLAHPPRPWPQALGRALLAGTAWGVPVASALTALTVWRCGEFCAADFAVNTALSIAAGAVTLGPLAAFGRPPAGRMG